MKKIIVNNNESGVRLDQYLTKKVVNSSRASIQNMIADNHVLVNKKINKPSYRVREGDEINLIIGNKPTSSILPEESDLKKLYEDENLIIIDKPANLIVHPTQKNKEKTLVNQLVYHYPNIINATFNQSVISNLRPGIVHRLDKDTSGLMLVAKKKKSLLYLSEEFKKHNVKKIYRALVHGWPNKTGELKSNIKRDPKKRIKMAEGLEGKLALSIFSTEKYFQTTSGDKVALVKIEIKTGRTHQIRLQFKNFGHPVLGDKIYNTKESRLLSKKLGIDRQMLHSSEITFRSGDNTIITRSSELPTDIDSVINKLKVISD